MKTKLITICLLFLIVFCVPSAFAREHIIDNAGILSEQGKASLEAAVASVSPIYNFDMVIVTERNIGSSDPAEYANNFFDKNGYGLGQYRDGCLLLLVTESRDYRFITSGRGINILNSAAANKLEGSVVKFLRENNPYEAFWAFLIDWEEFLELAAKGRNYNFFHQWNLVLVLIAWVLALAIGFIIVHTWKNKMDTPLGQTQAAAYMVPGSLAFRDKKDSFLYSTVNKTRLQTQNQNIASSGRGISAGGFSGGSSHGGRGGKY